MFGFLEDPSGDPSSRTSVLGQNNLPGSGVMRVPGDLRVPKRGGAINDVAVRLAGDAGESRQFAKSRLFVVHQRQQAHPGRREIGEAGQCHPLLDMERARLPDLTNQCTGGASVEVQSTRRAAGGAGAVSGL